MLTPTNTVHDPPSLLGDVRQMLSFGTKIRALNDRRDDFPEGELTDGILDQLAKFERAKTAERTRRGKLRKAREGKIVADRMATFGFDFNEDRDGYLVNQETMTASGASSRWSA